MNEELKQTDTFIRGSDLKVSEKDYFNSMGPFQHLFAWIFGGVFGMTLDLPNTITKRTEKRAVIAYIPPVWKRMYYKYLYVRPTNPMVTTKVPQKYDGDRPTTQRNFGKRDRRKMTDAEFEKESHTPLDTWEGPEYKSNFCKRERR